MSAERDSVADILNRYGVRTVATAHGIRIVHIGDCDTCRGVGTIPAANPEEPQDNGYTRCPDCNTEGNA